MKLASLSLPWARLKARLAVGLRSDEAFVRRVHRAVSGREPHEESLAVHTRSLGTGRSRFDVMADIARLQLRGEDVRQTLDRVFRRLLGRDVDPISLAIYGEALRKGWDAADVAFDLVESDEFINKLLRQYTQLPSLRAKRPDRFETARVGDATMDVFRVDGPGDVDWLEEQILTNRYYETPGTWSFALDWDKRAMAEILSGFAPRRALELGCSNGSVLKGLADLGYVAEGIEISALALERAQPEVKGRIHLGDVLTLPLRRDHDLVFGLDVFEHLNPNRLDVYLARLFDLLEDGGYLFANIPAHGPDPIFGERFDYHLPEWRHDAEQGRPFSLLPVDQDGYPKHGHLVVADWAWWTARFTERGFVREVQIERAIHDVYDPLLALNAPARIPFFVFSRAGDPQRSAALARGFHERTPLPAVVAC